MSASSLRSAYYVYMHGIHMAYSKLLCSAVCDTRLCFKLKYVVRDITQTLHNEGNMNSFDDFEKRTITDTVMSCR